MQQLFAKIKKSSEYSGQSDDIFEVLVLATQKKNDYIVIGGPGGQYRLKDVNLFVKTDMEYADELEMEYAGELKIDEVFMRIS